MSTPSERLRAKHVPYHKNFGADVFCRDCTPLTAWPCDVIQVLEAADALAEAVEAEHKPYRIRRPASEWRELCRHDSQPWPCDFIALARAYRGTE